MPVPVRVRTTPAACVRGGTHYGPKPTTKLSNSITIDVYGFAARDAAGDAVVTAGVPVTEIDFSFVFVAFVFCTDVVGSVSVSTGRYEGFQCLRELGGTPNVLGTKYPVRAIMVPH